MYHHRECYLIVKIYDPFLDFLGLAMYELEYIDTFRFIFLIEKWDTILQKHYYHSSHCLSEEVYISSSKNEDLLKFELIQYQAMIRQS